MGVNSLLPKTVTRQRRDYDLNPGPTAPESSTLTTRLPSVWIRKPQRTGSRLTVVCRVLCAQVVGATSSEGFLVEQYSEITV